jgi:hypothetical protein
MMRNMLCLASTSEPRTEYTQAPSWPVGGRRRITGLPGIALHPVTVSPNVEKKSAASVEV